MSYAVRNRQFSIRDFRRASDRKSLVGNCSRTTKKSGWWQELQQEDLSDHTGTAAKRFRGDFRVPYSFFEKLMELVKERDSFPIAATDAVGHLCIPVELKVSKQRDVCCVCVCFLPIHSGHQIRWTYQPGSHRRKVIQDFSSTFFLRCVL